MVPERESFGQSDIWHPENAKFPCTIDVSPPNLNVYLYTLRRWALGCLPLLAQNVLTPLYLDLHSAPPARGLRGVEAALSSAARRRVPDRVPLAANTKKKW